MNDIKYAYKYIVSVHKKGVSISFNIHIIKPEYLITNETK